ncbi:protein-ADP-ribose hydrolase [Clostridium transplantifaecale]|uniref:protein-ADP-ribose hydrolase n=1 Tax=Clostridium transplantifaecale TaxID=2479838 RepID=UPI000F630225|nr:protein-ADP-ribose hydrolase [Clostridium transplantifaecale]
MTQEERRIFLIHELLGEESKYIQVKIPEEPEEQKILLRALMNVRRPKPVNAQFLQIQDEYLQMEITEKGITDLDSLEEIQAGIYLWQGDITTLRCDAIVNAANSGMTGCYVPNHKCIDNCIHSFSGIQLRLACDKIIKKQGHDEATGAAKITRAFNLPCKYVLHTVGPVISGVLTNRDCDLLASCYSSCLKLAAEHGLDSIAFCCISTGEFHFPNQKAAEIAVQTVKNFMQTKTSIKKVIFNVYKDIDAHIYWRLLNGN